MKLATIAIAAYGLAYALFGGQGVQAHGKPTIYVVQQGQTLWAIANAHKPQGEDVRDYINQVQDLSHIGNGDAVQPGEAIKLP